MLPRQAYVDPEVFDWELRNIFSGWTCVGHASDITSVGALRAVGSGANGVLLVRSDTDEVRAFANTCPHRGHELLACGAETKKQSIICPYHSWSFRLDGTLRNAPGFRDADDFDPHEFGLRELHLVNCMVGFSSTRAGATQISPRTSRDSRTSSAPTDLKT